MSAETLLHLLVERGFRLKVDGDVLRVAPAGRLDKSLQQQIAAHKAGLVDLLAPPAITADEIEDIEEAIEERAAIREHDGGEDRATAEAKAAGAMRVYRLAIGMGEGEEARWVTMLAPGTDLPEARRIAELKFGEARVLAVIPHTPFSPIRPTGPATDGCGHL